LKKGDSVYHNKFGFGEVLEIEKSGSTVTRVKGNIRFNDFGIKKLLLDFAKLKKVL
jgi:DNA helicase-2/ATP-dependent DNA helicase PcrA